MIPWRRRAGRRGVAGKQRRAWGNQGQARGSRLARGFPVFFFLKHVCGGGDGGDLVRGFLSGPSTHAIRRSAAGRSVPSARQTGNGEEPSHRLTF